MERLLLCGDKLHTKKGRMRWKWVKKKRKRLKRMLKRRVGEL